MSTPDQPNHPGGGTGGYSGGQPGGPRDPYAPGPQPGYQAGPAPGYQAGYPGAAPGYPAGPAGYPPVQGGYPAQGGYPGPPPGYQSGQGAYPSYPGGPAGYPGYPGGAEPVPAPARPVTVTAAFWCWILVIAAWLVALIFVLTSSAWDQALQAATDLANRNSTSTVVLDAQTVINFVRVAAISGFVIFAGLYLLFAFKMRAGRNWARITLTVLGILGVLGSVTPGSRSVTVNGQVFASSGGPGWITAALTAVAVVLMFVGNANQFFTDSKAHRSQPR
ncbi:MAG TPA: hypothetical protein VFC16_18375 [Nakamurella sp.]|nr:hypothetical protein [Nakamurella sp.]